MHAGEPVSHRTSVAQTIIEALDVAVPIRLAGLDHPQRHLAATYSIPCRLIGERLLIIMPITAGRHPQQKLSIHDVNQVDAVHQVFVDNFYNVMRQIVNRGQEF